MSPRHVLACERGAAAVEFAIVSTLLIMLIVGGIDTGRALYVKNQLSFLADQAARTVLLDPYVGNAELVSRLATEFTAGDPNLLGVSLSFQNFAATDFRVVEISYPMATFIPFLNSTSLTLTVSRRIPQI